MALRWLPGYDDGSGYVGGKLTLKRPVGAGWTIVNREIGYPLDDFTYNGGELFRYPSASLSVGSAGADNYSVALNTLNGDVYLEVIHVPSLSIVNEEPSTTGIAFPVLPPLVDPPADSDANGMTFGGDPFPIPTAGYSIGDAGDTDFGIATDLDTATAIIDPVHTASLSIM
jgi:hypothetical protein